MDRFTLWEPQPQADILGQEGSFGNIEWTYPELIENIYEPMRKKHPDYITRRSIGFDTSGEYEMFAYEFTPKTYDRTVYLQSGAHVIETDAYFGLARLLQMIADGEDPRLNGIREHVRLLVVPVVSVWGISKRGSYEEIMDADRWRFPHNAARVNGNRDFTHQKAQETVNIIRYFAEYVDDICFAIDCHSTTDIVLGAYLLPYCNGMPDHIATKLKYINRSLYEKHPTPITLLFMGEGKDYPTNGPNYDPNAFHTYSAGFSGVFHVYTMTTEHNDYIYDSKLGTAKTMTLSVELLGNHLLQICEDPDFLQLTRRARGLAGTPSDK